MYLRLFHQEERENDTTVAPWGSLEAFWEHLRPGSELDVFLARWNRSPLLQYSGVRLANQSRLVHPRKNWSKFFQKRLAKRKRKLDTPADGESEVNVSGSNM